MKYRRVAPETLLMIARRVEDAGLKLDAQDIREAVKELKRLRSWQFMPDAERRQEYLSSLDTFNRSDLMHAFGVSINQASLDIRRWLEANPGKAIYNKSAKRYERLEQTEN